jgi:hypothetical protein
MITNIFIVAGVIKHWDDKSNTAELHVEVEVQENN